MPRKLKINMLQFTATWCGFCKAMAPEIKKFKAAHPEVGHVEINADANAPHKTFQKYHVSSIPALVFTDARGHELARLFGGARGADIEKAYERAKAALALQGLGVAQKVGEALADAQVKHVSAKVRRERKP